jgi:hypothetical protein
MVALGRDSRHTYRDGLDLGVDLEVDVGAIIAHHEDADSWALLGLVLIDERRYAALE